MKIVFCPRCQDVFKLQIKKRHCDCGKSYGLYLSDGVAAQIGGDAIPLGINNQSFAQALHLTGLMTKNPDMPGIPFNAFIIPEPCGTIRRK